MNLEGRRWCTVRQISVITGLHVQTCYKLFYSGKLPGARVGRSVRIDLKRLTEQMERQVKRYDVAQKQRETK